MRLAAVLLVLLLRDLCIPLLAVAGPGTAYGPRSNRREGLRSHPVSGQQLELISVLFDTAPAASSLPESLSVEFFLRDSTYVTAGSVDIIVRESNYSSYYWLDRPVPASGRWTNGRNVFSWPTSEVLATVDPNFPVTGLAALVVLGPIEPGRPIRTTPAILRGPAPATLPENCLLTYRPGARCKLQLTVREASSNRVVFNSGRPRTCDAELPADFLWNVRGLAPGTYRVDAEGTLLRTGAPVSLTALVELPDEVVRGGK